MLALSLTNKDIYCTYKKLHVEILSKVSTMWKLNFKIEW
jgi:hypothetical protein